MKREGKSREKIEGEYDNADLTELEAIGRRRSLQKFLHHHKAGVDIKPGFLFEFHLVGIKYSYYILFNYSKTRLQARAACAHPFNLTHPLDPDGPHEEICNIKGLYYGTSQTKQSFAA
eukprot:g53679.t1